MTDAGPPGRGSVGGGPEQARGADSPSRLPPSPPPPTWPARTPPSGPPSAAPVPPAPAPSGAAPPPPDGSDPAASPPPPGWNDPAAAPPPPDWNDPTAVPPAPDWNDPGAAPPDGRPRGVVVFWSMLGFIAFLMLLGFALRTGQTPDGDTTAAASPGPRGVQQEFSSTVTVSGSALEPLDPNATSAAQDPTLGTSAPVVTSEDFAGNPVTVPTPGEATIVVFLAHWCPHCQAEFPRLLDTWITPDLPDGVEVVAIPTAQAADQPNWPPSEWMLEGQPAWDEPVLLDTPAQDVARALGVTSYPFFLVIGPDGDVAARIAGEQGTEGLAAMVDFAAGLD